MQEIDVLLDNHPDMAEEMVRNAIRNQQAHSELQSYNDKKQFEYIHPIAIQINYSQSQNNNLKELLASNPDAFLNEITNTIQNIRRIKSDLNKKKYKDRDQHLSWQDNLMRAELKLQVMKKLISE